jgi:hypothetical protein
MQKSTYTEKEYSQRNIKFFSPFLATKYAKQTADIKGIHNSAYHTNSAGKLPKSRNKN